MLRFITQFLAATTATNSHHPPTCKATPGSPEWPTDSSWAALNDSLSGRLIKTIPPGAVCHPDQSTFNPAACPAVQAGWLTSSWHANNPVSTIMQNWNNDTCLPYPTVPCSGEGYPVYVVNAISPDDVKKGVIFARDNHIRLIVKGTGHDYLGRSVAPNSLSIWTRNMLGISILDGFKPKGCRGSIDGAAITVAAGTPMLDIDREASFRNLTIVSGGAGTVGMGGYVTGGGHAAVSSTYGLAADQVLEIEMVTPRGRILTVNECQHEDLFWAMRGGGGSTFGVITSMTIKAFPSSQFATVTGFLATRPGTESFWDVMATLLSKYPDLNSQGISGYSFIAPNFTLPVGNIKSPVDGFVGLFNLPLLYPRNTSASLTQAITDLFSSATAAYPWQFYSSVRPRVYESFYDYYIVNNGPLDAGGEILLGSRLLDEKALTNNLTALKAALRAATPPGSAMSVYPVAGKGVRDAVPRGGSNAVNPAWRRAVVHTIIATSWAPFDTAAKRRQENLMTHTYVEALRQLSPDMGAYINEADPNEPNFQDAFWGANYPRLLAIKRRYDPADVLWCHPCVGNERWEAVVGGDGHERLCRV